MISRSRRRSRPASFLVPLVAGAVLVATGGCSGDDSGRYSAACGVIVDGSGSGTLFDPGGKLKQYLPQFLQDKQCRTLAYVPVTIDSAASRCTMPTRDLDPDADSDVDRDALRDQERTQALAEAQQVLACAKANAMGSDVYGALMSVGNLRPAGKAPYYVLVDSDFVQADNRFSITDQDLSTAASRQAVQDRLTKNGLPALSGATVYACGFGMSLTGTPDQYQQFKQFWTDLLQGKIGANVDYHYQ